MQKQTAKMKNYFSNNFLTSKKRKPALYFFICMVIAAVWPTGLYSQIITENIIDLRTKQHMGTPHQWSFKPGDSALSGDTFARALQKMPAAEAGGWIKDFDVQLAYTRFKDPQGNRPFKDFDEYFKKYNGYGWYRTEFSVEPSDFKEKFKSEHIVIRLGKIGQADAVYLNGTFIGGTGLSADTPANEILADKHLFYDQIRVYKIPRNILYTDRPNVLAVRTFAKYNIAPGLSHGKYQIASDRKVERSIFWDDFKKIFVITLMVLLGFFYIYWYYLFPEQGSSTVYFSIGSLAMAANTLMKSQIAYSFLTDGFWIKKWEYISFIAVVHLVLDFFIKFSKVDTPILRKITKVWNIIALVAIAAVILISDLVTVRRFMFGWGVFPIFVLANIVYVIIRGRKVPSMGTVTGGFLGMLLLALNDVFIGFQFSWVTWENSLVDYAYAFFGLSVAGSIVTNMIKSKKLVEKQREEKKRLSRYFSPDVMETIIADELEMGGQEKPIATLFADISGFTSYSEKHHAAEVVDKLNLVFERLSKVIFEHGATLDKYIGDCIMAFWGAPHSTKDDAFQAVSCGFHMQKEMEKMTAELGPEEVPFRLRIGVNYGPSIVGNIGSKQRMDYTVIGDAVNTASRIESNGIAGKVSISESTYQAAGGDQYLSYSETKEIQVKGKTKPVQIYIISDVKPKPVSAPKPAPPKPDENGEDLGEDLRE